MIEVMSRFLAPGVESDEILNSVALLLVNFVPVPGITPAFQSDASTVETAGVNDTVTSASAPGAMGSFAGTVLGPTVTDGGGGRITGVLEFHADFVGVPQVPGAHDRLDRERLFLAADKVHREGAIRARRD